MSVKKDPTGRWRYRVRVRLPNGEHSRLSGSAPRFENTRSACERAEREAIALALRPVATRTPPPTYDEWFTGRFWKEWVIGERNKPSEQLAKTRHFNNYLRPAFGTLRLDQIRVEHVQQLRATLVERPLSDKSINNIMAVLSKSLATRWRWS